jgi:hypothetical protein
VATDAWMQHPTGYALGPQRRDPAHQLLGLLLNPWLLWQYLHNMIGRGGDRQLRDGGGRRVLSADGREERTAARSCAWA